MKLAALYEERSILIHMEEQTYAEAVGALVGSLRDRLERLSPESVCERLLSVEESLVIAPGHGVRIPHARLAGLNRLLLALGTSSEGILVDPETGERVHLIFLILTPKTQSTVMLQTMSSVARLVSIEENRKALVSTRSPARLLRILEETGIEVKKAIVAADLMNPAKRIIDPRMTLREVTAALAETDEEGLPVVAKDGRLLGDISTRMIIEIGLPKYMNLITDPQMLSEFEPFEAFYKREDSLLAEEVMNASPLSLAPETPVEIVAHQMITKKNERAYILDEKKLIGVVYRKDIVRKVLSL